MPYKGFGKCKTNGERYASEEENENQEYKQQADKRLKRVWKLSYGSVSSIVLHEANF